MANIGSGLLGITWEDGRVGGKTRTYAQVIDNTGTKSWAANGVEVSNRTGNQVTPFVIPDGIGGMIVSWEDMTAGITESDLYAQRFSASGSPQWSAAGEALGTAAKMQQSPAMTGDGTLPLEPAILTFSSYSIAFGSVGVGYSSTKTVTLTNTGNDTLRFASFSSEDPHFTVETAIDNIEPAGSRIFTIRFAPTAEGSLNKFLVLSSNAVSSPDTLVVQGAGIKVVSARPLQSVPGAFTLHRNYPNPFHASTSIRYDLAASAPVMLTIHDALGRLVATLVDETQHPGSYSARWTPANALPGMYFLTLRVGAEESTRRMLLMR